MVRQVRGTSLRGAQRRSNLNPTHRRIPHNVRTDIPVEKTEFWKQMDRNRVGNLLAGARLKAGLTQGQLAKKLGIRQNTVSDYEHGRRSLSPAMTARFCAVLHIKASHLKRRDETRAGH